MSGTERFWIERAGVIVLATFEEWRAYHLDKSQGRVDCTELEGAIVATAFNGCEAASEPLEAAPLVYETTLCAPEDADAIGAVVMRYHTREAAQRGHASIVAAIRAGEPVDALKLEP